VRFLSYQVLARKWRPKSFAEVVGQKHVLQGLINALDNNRLHHAYLFTGTRGVGKTTLGRIFAKSLNCEEGLSATPCGICSSCIEIDEGRFVDLLEVDAASRTKVDETRELLENVQYAPSRGRFKVYLIDEVHMLTTHSFNALLKTLEEPPPHVKFILATTDPQKLPVTILSRCLKFNLKTIPQDLITGHMGYVLEQEGVKSESSGLKLIARSAKGSMRDALSLLDQAIAHGNGQVMSDTVREMLGTIDNKDIVGIVEALIDQNAPALLQHVEILASHGVVFSTVLAELVSVLHMLAIAQAVPDVLDEDNQHLLEFAKKLSAEEVQLFYQIALMGQQDLPLAPDPRAGFEMILLRMYAFQPEIAGQDPDITTKSQQPTAAASVARVKPAVDPRSSALEQVRGQVSPMSSSPPEQAQKNNTDTAWDNIVNQLPLSGLPRQLASHCVFVRKDGNQLDLLLSPVHAHLGSEKILQRLQEALSQFYAEDVEISLTSGEAESDTPAIKQEKQHKQNLNEAVQAMEQDPNVVAMKEILNAKLDTQSVKLVDKN